MGVRIWGVVGDRLIEVCATNRRAHGGLLIIGLPNRKARSTADRVRSALLNSALLTADPRGVVTVTPAVMAGATSDLDLAIAVACLAAAGRVRRDLGWIFAVGRLGLDGSVRDSDTGIRAEIAESLAGIVVPGR